MLLFVREPQLHERGPLRGLLCRAGPHELREMLVDVAAVGRDRLDGRAAQQAALRPRMARPQGFVIGVEEEREIRVERRIAGQMRTQEQRLPEPRGVREMPFRRARVRHRLNRLILAAQRGRERIALRAHAPKLFEKTLGQAFPGRERGIRAMR